MRIDPVRQPAFLSSYGRNRGRSLRSGQQQLIEELLPRIEIPSARHASGDRLADVSRLCAMDAGYAHHALEIGFGAGEHLLAQAAHHPDTLFIGCEPYINGVAKCLAGIARLGLGNIRLFTNDARLLLRALPDNFFDRVFILFPDPWPKARHNKRRLVNQQTLAMLARTHKQDGRLLLATDHEDYALWMREQLALTPYYHWPETAQAAWLIPPADWTQTKYQRKTSAEGRAPKFFVCRRSDVAATGNSAIKTA